MKVYRKTAAVIAAVATVLGISACGATNGAAGGAGNGITPEAQDAVDAAYEGGFGEPPSESPAPEPGKNIWLITASAQYVDFQADGQIVDGAEQLGWDMTVFDGQFNPDTMVSGLRQAIADQADGVILFGIDCAIARAGLEDVADAGIPTVAFEGTDCSDSIGEDGVIVDSGDPALFDAVVTYDDPKDPGTLLTFPEFYRDVAAANQALGIIEGTDGAGKIIKIKETDSPLYLAVDAGFDQAVDTYCPDCEIVETIEITGADLGPTLQDKVAQAIARHPEANAIYGIYDAVILNFAPAVMASGRKDDIYVMAGEGTAPVVSLVEEGRGVNAGMVYPVAWESWAALDAMNRLLAGEKPDGAGFPSGMGMQLYDAERNTPDADAAFIGPVDFPSAYRKAWGLGAE
jgi:ribose transport system substrate-binding protein